MKILMVNTYYEPNFHGGADISVRHLAEGLHQAGHDVGVVTLASGLEGSTGKIGGVHVLYLAINNRMSHIRNPEQSSLKKALWQAASAFNLSMPQRLQEICEQEQPDVLHTHILAGFSTKPWLVARRLSIPVAHTLHDYFFVCPRGTMFRGNAKCPGQCRDCKFVTRLRKRETQKVAAVISVSDFTLREHISRGYFSRVPIKRTIYNSATAEKITSSKNREGPLRLGFLGRLEVFKGLDVLLKALSRISVEKVSLKIAGIGPSGYVNYLVSKWPLPNAEYLGLIDPIELWSEIDVLVVPSIYYDPAPRVVLEAIAHGIPVLGNTYGGMSELIEEEKTGWICNLSHPDTLQKRINQLVTNPERCREMRRDCLNSANRFSPKEMVNRHVELYEHLLA